MYIVQRTEWPNFSWRDEDIQPLLAVVFNMLEQRYR